jgi:putative lipoprotein
MIRTLLLAAVGLSLSACGFTRGATPATPVGPIPSELTGTVSSRERIALAPDTQLRVRLEEISGGEAPPQFIAETTIPRIRQPPVRFRIALDPGVIDAKRSYTLTARIERDEQLLFINDPPMRVLTGGNPSQVEIVVSPAAGRR